jgi:hypothetical protein
MTTKPHYKRFFKESYIQTIKANKTMKGQAVPNHRSKGKKVESNIDSAAHNQTLKQQKQNMTGATTYLSILTLNVNSHNSPIKRHCLALFGYLFSSFTSGSCTEPEVNDVGGRIVSIFFPSSHHSTWCCYCPCTACNLVLATLQ